MDADLIEFIQFMILNLIVGLIMWYIDKNY